MIVYLLDGASPSSAGSQRPPTPGWLHPCPVSDTGATAACQRAEHVSVCLWGRGGWAVSIVRTQIPVSSPLSVASGAVGGWAVPCDALVPCVSVDDTSVYCLMGVRRGSGGPAAVVTSPSIAISSGLNELAMAPTRRSRKSCAAGRAYDVLSQAVCSIATCAYDPRHKAERPAASSLLPPNRLVQGLLERCYRPGPSSASAREQIGKSGRLWSRPIPGRSNRVRGRFACAGLARPGNTPSRIQPAVAYITGVALFRVGRPV